MWRRVNMIWFILNAFRQIRKFLINSKTLHTCTYIQISIINFYNLDSSSLLTNLQIYWKISIFKKYYMKKKSYLRLESLCTWIVCTNISPIYIAYTCTFTTLWMIRMTTDDLVPANCCIFCLQTQFSYMYISFKETLTCNWIIYYLGLLSFYML